LLPEVLDDVACDDDDDVDWSSDDHRLGSLMARASERMFHFFEPDVGLVTPLGSELLLGGVDHEDNEVLLALVVLVGMLAMEPVRRLAMVGRPFRAVCWVCLMNDNVEQLSRCSSMFAIAIIVPHAGHPSSLALVAVVAEVEWLVVVVVLSSTLQPSGESPSDAQLASVSCIVCYTHSERQLYQSTTARQ
jgi:hypothetical protein